MFLMKPILVVLAGLILWSTAVTMKVIRSNDAFLVNGPRGRVYSRGLQQ